MKKADTILLIFSLVISLPAWVYLYRIDWRIALALTFIITGNNIVQSVK